MIFFYFVALLCIGFQACCADIPVTPPVRCGAIPRGIFMCLNMPRVVKPGIAEQCKDAQSTQCERMTCLFEKSGWMDGKKVDQVKLKAHFDEFSKQNSLWTPAIDHMKEECFRGDLPAQGIHLDCPAYDVMQCSLASFIKNSPPSTWSSAMYCDYPRQFAASCPICPSDCFDLNILLPTGTCSGCNSLPFSP